MAEFTGPDYRTLQKADEHGNANVAILTYEFAGEAAASIVKLGKLSGAIRIHRVVAIADDLGAAQTMDIGYRYLNSADGTDDPDGFFDGIDTGTAASNQSVDLDLTIANGKGIEVVASNIGAAATGSLSVKVEYQFLGQ